MLIRLLSVAKQVVALFEYFNETLRKWIVTILVADPAIYKLFLIEDLHPYPHVRPVMVPGAGLDQFPDILEETQKTVAELEIA